MLRIGTDTKLTPEDAVKKAVDFFGPKGYKLKITQQTATSVNFEGGGGFIELTASADKPRTKVEIMSREWDFQVNEFLKKIH